MIPGGRPLDPNRTDPDPTRTGATPDSASAGGPRPDSGTPPGIRDQLRATRAAVVRAVRAHIALARAEADEIKGEIARAAALGGLAAALLFLLAFLLPIGLILFTGEWIFGSIGWGVLHGTEFLVALAFLLVLVALRVPGLAVDLVLAIVIGIIVGAVLGANLPNELWRRIGESVNLGDPAWRPLVVGTLVMAGLGAIVGLFAGAGAGGIGAAIGGLVGGGPGRGAARRVLRDHVRLARGGGGGRRDRAAGLDRADGRARGTPGDRHRGTKGTVLAADHHRHHQGDARVGKGADAREAEVVSTPERILEGRPAVAAARAEALESRKVLGDELDRLEASARAAVDIPARVRRNPVRTAGVAAGAGFLLVGGPAKVLRRARNAVFGKPDPLPKSMLPKEIDKALGELGPDGARVRGTLEREFAAYLKEKGPERRERDLAGVTAGLLAWVAKPVARGVAPGSSSRSCSRPTPRACSHSSTRSRPAGRGDRAPEGQGRGAEPATDPAEPQAGRSPGAARRGIPRAAARAVVGEVGVEPTRRSRGTGS